MACMDVRQVAHNMYAKWRSCTILRTLYKWKICLVLNHSGSTPVFSNLVILVPAIEILVFLSCKCLLVCYYLLFFQIDIVFEAWVVIRPQEGLRYLKGCQTRKDFWGEGHISRSYKWREDLGHLWAGKHESCKWSVHLGNWLGCLLSYNSLEKVFLNLHNQGSWLSKDGR